jgi:hypothetical protein
MTLRPFAAEVLILIMSFCDVKTVAALRTVDVFFRDRIDNLQAVRTLLPSLPFFLVDMRCTLAGWSVVASS